MKKPLAIMTIFAATLAIAGAHSVSAAYFCTTYSDGEPDGSYESQWDETGVGGNYNGTEITTYCSAMAVVSGMTPNDPKEDEINTNSNPQGLEMMQKFLQNRK